MAYDDDAWLTGNYNSGDPAVDAAARRAYLDRQRRMHRGWTPERWTARRTAPLDGAVARALMDRREVLEEQAADSERIDQDIELHDICMRRRQTEFAPDWR